MAPPSILRPMVVAAAGVSVAVMAQAPSPQQSPVPAVTPVPAPGTIPVEPPAPLATPILTPRPGIDDMPTPVFVPNPRRTPAIAASAPTATPVAASSPAPSPTPNPAPTATPSPRRIVRPPIETVILPQERGVAPGGWIVGGVALLLVMAGGFGLRRQRDAGDAATLDPEVIPAPVAAPSPVSPAAGGQARLAIALRPTRAGLNLISATAEGEVTVVNIGDAIAADIRASARLTSAREGQDAELAAFYVDAGSRTATPVFALMPGEERRFRAVMALPHDAIHSIEAGGRPMFVPLVALSVRYRDGEAPHRIGQAYMLGVDQGESAKLAPIWLDGPARSYDKVAARLHGEPIEG